MAEGIPRKKTRRVDNAPDALTLTIDVMAAAAEQGMGVNLETIFPGGRLRVVIGSIEVTHVDPDAPAGEEGQQP